VWCRLASRMRRPQHALLYRAKAWRQLDAAPASMPGCGHNVVHPIIPLRSMYRKFSSLGAGHFSTIAFQHGAAARGLRRRMRAGSTVDRRNR